MVPCIIPVRARATIACRLPMSIGPGVAGWECPWGTEVPPLYPGVQTHHGHLHPRDAWGEGAHAGVEKDTLETYCIHLYTGVEVDQLSTLSVCCPYLRFTSHIYIICLKK